MSRAIEKLTIKGFKSIRALEDFELRSLNVLIGANGAGKSNFVDFFTMLREMVDQNLQVYVYEHGRADAHLFLGPKVTREVVGELHFPPNWYRIKLKRTVRNELFFAEEAAGFSGGLGEKEDVLGKGHAEATLKEYKDEPGVLGKKGIEHYVYRSVASWTVYHFHDTSDTAPVRGECSVRDNERLHADAGNLAAFLLRLREGRSGAILKKEKAAYELIRDAVRLVAPFFDDFKLRPEPNGQDEVVSLEWTQKGSDYPFHSSQLSDGTLRFMCMAAALLQPHPPATMLFDEPELGLHPYALNVLAGLMKQAATRTQTQTQLIVSTQSAALLDCFEPEDVIVVDRKDGASQFRRLDKAQLSEWLEQYSLGELWQKNVFEGGPACE
ncbi:MAG: AAA family ATPase [Phycisphaerae bacterium]|jgi:predicted ATPase